MADPWANDPVVGNVNVTSSGAATGQFGLPVAKLTITPPGAPGTEAGGILAPSANDTPWAGDPIVQPAQIKAPSDVPVSGIGAALTALSGSRNQQQAHAPPAPMVQGRTNPAPAAWPAPVPLGQLAPLRRSPLFCRAWRVRLRLLSTRRPLHLRLPLHHLCGRPFRPRCCLISGLSMPRLPAPAM